MQMWNIRESLNVGTGNQSTELFRQLLALLLVGMVFSSTLGRVYARSKSKLGK
jgi:hypothetical protein